MPIGSLRVSLTGSGLRPTPFVAADLAQRQPDPAAVRGGCLISCGGHVFDGELVVLDDAGRPLFNALLFGRRRPHQREDLRFRFGRGALRPFQLRALKTSEYP
jgi:hypothetical protein